MADQVEAWITDGDKNSENFFVDDDGPKPLPGTAPISVGGIFSFYVELEAPFAVKMRTNPSSPSLKRFLQLANPVAHTSIAGALTAATKAYLAIADALDEENAEDDDYVEDADDAFDQAEAAGATEAEKERRRREIEMNAQFEQIKAQFDVSGLQKATVDRIMSDYNGLRQSQHHGWKAAPEGRNLMTWALELFDFDKGTDLHKDMEKVRARTGKAAVEMTIQFPTNYPYAPPFIRVVRPRFQFRTGRVTVGGSICTQILTDDGWKPVFDIESIIETIRQQITDPESGAKIDHGNTSDYTEAEARDAFARVAEHHKRVGW